MHYDDSDRVRLLDELEHWQYNGTALAVLGSPITHSVSPAMHNAALNLMGQTQQLYRNWRYFKFNTPPEILHQALEKLHQAGFTGINLTIPHKVQAVDLVVEIDAGAKLSGAVNTLHRQENGWAGYNSDGYGLEQALKRELGVELAGATVILLGAGGAARAAAVQCLQSGVAALWIGNRNQERLEGLIELLADASGCERVRGFDLSAPPSDLPTDGVIVNATSLGLKADDPVPLKLSRFGSDTKIYDMTYGVENDLARTAKTQGLAYADGLSMLVWQGVRSLEIWTGAQVPAQAMMDGACYAKGYTPRRA
ncbi:shikimate dehydrogenase family protein [Cerasicoccus arenae]|uniref:Shikimate dehydrogenase (NADP(+)) n=1 Tax=Cerasicoccus arenae TaxID=424488 RepID=A0A8J3DDI7_9BACT|nr:shikimate dehydrogenase [Cerasicoccus arenae]MBK1858506.1 shikimate dehydrogenase [Cerasicoccus arenae]GHC10202.1 shikimate dehydrogenase [Cerasicoccus arenae]